MKIKEVKSYALSYTKDYPSIPRSFFIVKVETDEGIVGYGEASTAYGHNYPLVVKEIVDGTFRRILLNEDATDIGNLVNKMRTYVWGYLGAGGVANQAISAIEIALWDILGKVASMPIYKLLGADKDAVEVYATGTVDFTTDFAWHVDFFERKLEEGFKGIKIRVGKDRDWDEEFVKSVRKFVGDDIKIMIDAFMTYRPETADEMSKRFSAYSPYFFEEPIAQHDLSSLHRLTQRSPIPIALGERVSSLFSFKDLIERKIGSIFQPDATIVGGIKECYAICNLAEGFGIPCIPHIGGLTAIGYAANLHVALASRNVSLLEVDGADSQPLRDDLLLDPIFDTSKRLKDGKLLAPTGSGLGIQVDETTFERYPFERGGPIYPPDIYSHYGASEI